MKIAFVRLPAWPGGLLAAEYDVTTDVARINSDAVARIRERLGGAAAERFIACAIAHERFHRDAPCASEADARAHVAQIFGDDAARFERALRV